MKYDEYGVICGVDEIDHIQGFLDIHDADRYFTELKKLPWEKAQWKAGRYLPRLVFRYGDGGKKHDVLEDLVLYVEEVLETRVQGVWCNYYEKPSDYTPYHQDSYNCGVLSLSFGGDREFCLKNNFTSKVLSYTLSHGDAFYFTPEVNSEHRHSLLKGNAKSLPRISIVFFMDEPYSRRKNLSSESSTSEKTLSKEEHTEMFTKEEIEFLVNIASLIMTRDELERPVFQVYSGKFFDNDEYYAITTNDDVSAIDDRALQEFLRSDYLIDVRGNPELLEKYLKPGPEEMLYDKIQFVFHKSNIQNIYETDPWIVFMFHSL